MRWKRATRHRPNHLITSITRKGLQILERMQPAMEETHREFGERLPGRDARELSRICEGIYDVEGR